MGKVDFDTKETYFKIKKKGSSKRQRPRNIKVEERMLRFLKVSDGY